MAIRVATLDKLSRGSTIKIAAHNASEKSKMGADYVCDGVSDLDIFTQAVAELDYIGGGTLELSEGRFNLVSDELTDVTYPFTEDWVYLRAIIDFDSKTFKLYQGATMDTMVPFVEGTTTFTFKNTNASNVYKFYTGYKGVYAYDDVNIYTVSTSGGSPVELPTEVIGNVGQGIIDEWHVYQDFEEAYNESDKVIIVPNLAKSNDYIVWNQNTTRTQNFYTIVNGDAVNTTKYIKGVRKSQIPIEMTIDTHDSSGNPTPSPVTGSGKLVYFDMRMKRVSLSDDPVTLKLMDSSNNEIFNIYFPTNSIPQLVASQTYGAVTSDPALTELEIWDDITIKGQGRATEIQLENVSIWVQGGSTGFKDLRISTSSNYAITYRGGSHHFLDNVQISSMKGIDYLNADSNDILLINGCTFSCGDKCVYTDEGHISISNSTLRSAHPPPTTAVYTADNGSVSMDNCIADNVELHSIKTHRIVNSKLDEVYAGDDVYRLIFVGNECYKLDAPGDGVVRPKSESKIADLNDITIITLRE